MISNLPNTSIPVIGQHYCLTNPITGAGLVPKWDFTTSGIYAGNKDAYVVARRVTGIPVPPGNVKDVDWAVLEALPTRGSLASKVFRIDTKGGMPQPSVG